MRDQEGTSHPVSHHTKGRGQEARFKGYFGPRVLETRSYSWEMAREKGPTSPIGVGWKGPVIH